MLAEPFREEELARLIGSFDITLFVEDIALERGFVFELPDIVSVGPSGVVCFLSRLKSRFMFNRSSEKEII